jgi:ubiquitin carboxyl-terminal hydrolase 22/27/51
MPPRQSLTHAVTPTTLSAVLSQKAYMLFYVKRSLAYAQPMQRLLSNTGGTTVNGTGTTTPAQSMMTSLSSSTTGTTVGRKTLPGISAESGVGGKSLGGKGHPIRGMEV